jgi:hypothetical protein
MSQSEKIYKFILSNYPRMTTRIELMNNFNYLTEADISKLLFSLMQDGRIDSPTGGQYIAAETAKISMSQKLLYDLEDTLRRYDNISRADYKNMSETARNNFDDLLDQAQSYLEKLDTKFSDKNNELRLGAEYTYPTEEELADELNKGFDHFNWHGFTTKKKKSPNGNEINVWLHHRGCDPLIVGMYDVTSLNDSATLNESQLALDRKDDVLDGINNMLDDLVDREIGRVQ